MKTIDITVSIPFRDDTRPSPQLILKAIAELLHDGLSEIDRDGWDDYTTVADMLGFGGNTLTLTTGDLVEEVCL
jgi:hypothetical protein